MKSPVRSSNSSFSDADAIVAPTTTKLLLTPQEAASMLSIGRSTVYELMAAAKLESVRIGGSRRIPAVALEAFVRRLQEDGASTPWWQR